ncbi:MAG: DUF2314 domain-containing protein [Candidatus Sumerlaeia bacterium]|nr:DUF2314 domain-containing protein [Candidatus Sumerlaeia bacterium]
MFQFILRTCLLGFGLMLTHQLLQAQALEFSDKTFQEEEAKKSVPELLANPDAGPLLKEYSITIFTDHVGDPGEEEMEKFLENQFGTTFQRNNPAIENVIAANFPHYFFRINGNSYLATFSQQPRPFLQQDIDFLSKDPLMQRMLVDHVGYVHLQLVGYPPTMTEGEAYELLTTFGAGFCLQGSTRCVVSFPLQRFFIFDEINVQDMMEPNSIQLFHTGKDRSGGSANVEAKRPKAPNMDAELDKIKKISQDRLSILKQEIAYRKTGWKYQVFADYTDEAGVREGIWLDVMSISGRSIEGEVLEPPQYTKAIVQGQVIKVPDSSVINWMVTNGQEGIYGYEDPK